jgi:hypothetical protein
MIHGALPDPVPAAGTLVPRVGMQGSDGSLRMAERGRQKRESVVAV